MDLRTTPETRFDSFHVHKTFYKKIGSHEIDVYILIPKSIKAMGSTADEEKKPLFVKWHGGGLTTGDAAYTPWFSAFLIPFFHRASAITILPNYRLAPEARGDDILADIASFWNWLRNDFPSYLSSITREHNLTITPDFTRVCVSGDSAGGWPASQSILTQPLGTIKCAFLQYPVLKAFNMDPEFKPFGESIPPASTLQSFLDNIPKGKIISSAPPDRHPERDMLSPMLRAHNRWAELFGAESYLMPDTRLGSASWWVPMTIVHGRGDSVVKMEYSREFIDAVREKFGDVRVELVTPEGEHGFDESVMEGDEGAGWLGDMLRGVERDWLE